MKNPFKAARQAMHVEIDRISKLYEELKAQERSWDLSRKGTAVVRKTTERNGATRGGRREAVNPGKSWPEAIEAILADGKGRTVNEVVDELIAQGRRFGPKSRPDAVVRNALRRGASRFGWSARGNPKRWSKRLRLKEGT